MRLGFDYIHWMCYPKRIPGCLYVQFCIFVVLLLGGCGKNVKTLRIAVSSIPVQIDPVLSVDPNGRRIAAHLYESLFRQNEHGDILPHLAWKREYNTSFTQLTIHLREGVLFHDGDLMTAQDVVYSLLRIVNVEEEDMLGMGTAPEQLGRPLTIQAIDDLTLEIVISSPHYSLLKTLTTPFLTPIIKEESGNGSVGSLPVGTGPYRMKHHSPGRGNAVLERFAQYWGTAPGPERIRFKEYFGDEERLDALEAGKADIALNIAVSSVNRVNNSNRLELVLAKSLGWIALGINNQLPPFDDVNARRALAMALDTERIVSERWQRAGVATRHFVGDGLEPDLRGPPAPGFNPEGASELFSPVITSGTKPLIFLRSPGAIPEKTERLVNLLRVMLGEYGFEVKQEYFERFGEYENRLKEGDWNLIIDGSATDNGDLYSSLYEVYGRTNPDGSIGLFHMEGDEFLSLLELANATVDAEEREDLFRSAVEWIAEQIPCIPLADFKSFLVQSSKVKGLNPGPFSDWTFSSVSKDGWK